MTAHPYPNFFVVGAAKSGTTAFYKALGRHPDVFLPTLKEPHVYAYLADPSTASHLYPDESTARREYAALYAGATGRAAIGDCSTTNLVVPGAAAEIAKDVPAARIVVILRQPVDRAYSHWRHFVVAGGDDIGDFAEAVRQEEARQEAGYPFTYCYLGWGRYADQLVPFFDLFGRDQVLVHLYDDLCADAEAVIRRTFRFLAIDDRGPIPAMTRENEMPRGAFRRRRRPALDPAVRADLTRRGASEISRLETLLGRDLSHWR